MVRLGRFVLALVLILGCVHGVVAQTTVQRQHQILTQVETLLNELRGTLPPLVTEVNTSTAIVALFKSSGNYKIAPGTYQGNFTISGSDLTIDATGVRFVPTDMLNATLTITGARIRLMGLTVVNPAPDRDTINVGVNTATSLVSQPHDVVLERVTAEAGVNGGHRGFGLHGVNITLLDCKATGFWETGRDSQGVWINNGPGPYTIEGGYFEASGENILTGGSSPGINDLSSLPTNIIIRGARLYKPLEWKATAITPKRGSVKNLLEFKVGRKILVENCVLENNWKDAQNGSSIVITPRSQGGQSPWVVVEDVVLRNNTLKNAPDGYAVNILGSDDTAPSGRTKNVTLEHNLFVGVTNGVQVGDGVDGELVVNRNTFLTVRGKYLSFYGRNSDGTARHVTALRFTGNVTHEGDYGILGDGLGVGMATLNAYTQVLDFNGNVIERGPRWLTYPVGTTNTFLTAGQLLPRLDPATFKYPGDVAGY